MHDIVIVSVPYIAYTAPAAAPALLKGFLKQHGFAARALDLNVEFRNSVNRHNAQALPALINHWTNCHQPQVPVEYRDLYADLLNRWAKVLLESQPKWLGLSVFSPHSWNFVRDFLPYLKQHQKTTKLLLGGHGLELLFVEEVKHHVDAYILGEGELALRELLLGNFDYPGINSPGVQITDLDQLGQADYSDYNLHNNYVNWYDGPMIQITGSRGCVRNCSFCNVPMIWNKYRYRSGTLLAQEIIANHESTGINHFYFTDSLINGSLRSLMDMMRSLAEYRRRTGSKITWGGQWITRPQKGLPKDYYPLIKASGGYNLTMGVETGSDKVRQHMNKQFTNLDLDAEMEQFSRHRIQIGFFLMLGYPTETQEDFFDTLRMLKRYVKYVADGTIIGVCTGRGYEPGKNTPLAKQNLTVGANGQWQSTVTKSNYLENIRRRIIIGKVLKDLEWPSPDLEFEIRPLLHTVPQVLDSVTAEDVEALLPSSSLDPPAEFLAPTKPHKYSVVLDLEGRQGQTWPEIEISINRQVVFSGTVGATQTLQFECVDLRRRNTIKILLKNKTPADSVVKDDELVLDKSVLINAISIDEVLLLRDEVYDLARVRSPDRPTVRGNGLYFNNSELTLYFENPPKKYFVGLRRFYFSDRFSSSDLLEKLTQLFQHGVTRQSH